MRTADAGNVRPLSLMSFHLTIGELFMLNQPTDPEAVGLGSPQTLVVALEALEEITYADRPSTNHDFLPIQIRHLGFDRC